MELIKALGITTFSRAKRLIKIVIGFSVLGFGIALIVLPGPAFIVIPLGLAILAGEFVWAKLLLAKFNTHVRNAGNSLSIFRRAPGPKNDG